MKNCIETASGKFVNLVEPTVNDIVTEDIIWPLCRMPRFAGHTLTEIPYTVGQHSIYTCKLVQELFKPDNTPAHKSFAQFVGGASNFAGSVHGAPVELLLKTLLHDASEAYLMDLPTPVKNLPGLKQEYEKLETRMMDVIYQKFDLSEATPEEQIIIKWADAFALSVESYHLMKSRGKDWAKTLEVNFIDLQKFEGPKPALMVYSEFSVLLAELCGKLCK